MLRSVRGLLTATSWLALASCSTPLGDVLDANRDAAMAAPALSAATSPDPGDGAASARSTLPISWDFGLPVVETTIDGRGPWRFLLDSGAYAWLGIDRSVAESLGLVHLDTRDLFGRASYLNDPGGGKLSVRETLRVGELRVGPLVLRDCAAIVVDLEALRRAGAEFDGILPASLFRKGLLTFEPEHGPVTYAAGELPHADGRRVLEFENTDEPSVSIDVGGGPCRILIDTGSRGFLTVPAAREEEMPFVHAPAVVGVSLTLAATSDRREGRLRGTIDFGGTSLVEPVVDLGAVEHGWAGMSLLRRFRMTFDFANRRVRFERPADEPIRSPSVRSAGAAFVHSGDAWTIRFLLEGGPAEAAGLRVGDRVDAIDGRPVSELREGGYREILDTRDSVKFHVLGEGTPRDVVVAIRTLVE